jgi:glycolate oxidase iron-sulfur subunit
MAKKIKFDNLKEWEKELNKCTTCGYCTFWCPIYQEDPKESSVTRGKLAVLKDLLSGKQEFRKETFEVIERCLLCNTCFEHCPEKVVAPSAILAARRDIANTIGVKFPFNLVYRYLIPHRRIFGNIVKVASWFQDIFLPKTKGTLRHLPLYLSALGKGRHIPSIAPKFLRQLIPEVNKPPVGVETKMMRVGYFIGCMNDFVFPQTGKRIVDFLTRNGVEVIIPKGQGCCGAPVFLGAGDFDTGRKLADTNVKIFNDLNYVVCSCATGTSTMKEYVKYLADTPERQEAYAKFGAKVKDINEFLVDVLKLPSSAYHAVREVKGKKVTWHDPCHLIRYLGIKEQPRQILKSLRDVEYVEMVRPDWCCGMAGAFSLHYYELSKQINDKKMNSIEESGADIVATGCPGCVVQLSDNVIRRKLPVKVMHIMDLLE